MFEAYITAISSQRLESYREPGCSDVETLTSCIWNIALCESFYPSLQYLEIGLRNAIHDALTFSYRNPLWFKESFMCIECSEDIKIAIDKLKTRQKDHCSAGRIVAELKFGFWTRLFNKHYQQPLWNNKTFLLRAFPKATSQQRTRINLAGRVDELRRFRNRVFHHEKIVSHRLNDVHDQIYELLGWINPVLLESNRMLDRFPVTITTQYYDSLKEKIQATEFHIL